MASSLKFDGKLILQTQSDGPVQMLVADVTTDGALRGYVQFDEARYADLGMHDFRSLLGKGYIAFTVDQGQYAERYQGIVDLDGGNLAELGTQCLVFGPGSIDVAHKPDEYIPMGELIRGVEVVRDLVQRRCLA